MEINCVDIIIVNLNGRHYLEQCLPSIERETKGISYQLVIVDNGSEDNSIDWIKRNYPSAILIQNGRNVGFSKACNQGILQTSGKYILLLNNDTIFLNNVASILSSAIDSIPQVGLVGPLMMFPDLKLQTSIYRFPPVWKFVIHQLGISIFLGAREKNIFYPYGPFIETEYQKQSEVDWLSGACVMFSRNLFNSLGMLDEGMPFGVEDMDFAKRAKFFGAKNYFIPDAKIIHHKRGSHAKQKAFVFSSYEIGLKAYYRKNLSTTLYLVVFMSMIIGKLPRFFRDRFLH